MPPENESIEIASLPTDRLEAELAQRRSARARADAEIRRAQEERQRLEDAELAAAAKRRAEEERAKAERERIEAQQRADATARRFLEAADCAVKFVRLAHQLGDGERASIRLHIERSCGDIMSGWVAARFVNYLLNSVGGGDANSVEWAREYVARLDAAAVEAKKTEGGAQ